MINVYHNQLRDVIFMNLSSVTFPPEIIAEWERAADELVQKIERDKLLLSSYQRRLAAIRVLARKSEIRSEMSPSEAILFYLEQLDGPISQAKLREHMYECGYQMENFGEAYRYFYTLLSRLERRGKVLREGDEVSLVRGPDPTTGRPGYSGPLRQDTSALSLRG
jgi:hypothetical protein